MFLEAITGPMFSGKSEEVARRLRRAAYADKKIVLMKPGIDNRDQRNIFDIVKEDKKLSTYEFLNMASINSPRDWSYILNPPRFDILAIDEVQLLEKRLGKLLLKSLTKTIQTGCRLDITVIVAGLDMDAWRKPFGIMPDLMAMADNILKLTAICKHCKGQNGLAIFTQKKSIGSGKQVEVGNEELYEARCRACHTIPE
ncbi:MAG: hypothetical protein Q8N81_03025 [bacterium]|nr:hypothetical protein [bacterium]